MLREKERMERADVRTRFLGAGLEEQLGELGEKLVAKA